MRLAIIMLVTLGLIAQQFSAFYALHGRIVAFLYFTTQSNILLLVVNALLLSYELKNKLKPKPLLTLEHIAVSATTLTFVVFALLLGPFVEKPSYFYSVTNLTLHNFAPILGVITYLMTKEKTNLPAFIAVSAGLYYLIFAYTVFFVRGNFGPTKFPYFFLDFETNGWLTFSPPTIGVIYYFVIIFFLLWGTSELLLKLKQKENKKKVALVTFTLLFTLSFVINLLNVILKTLP